MRVFKLHNDKVETLLAWGAEVQLKHKPEALDSLREENCTREIFQVFEGNGQWFLICHMEGENLLPANMEKELNQKHREVIMSCIDRPVESEVVYDLKT